MTAPPSLKGLLDKIPVFRSDRSLKDQLSADLLNAIRQMLWALSQGQNIQWDKGTMSGFRGPDHILLRAGTVPQSQVSQASLIPLQVIADDETDEDGVVTQSRFRVVPAFIGGAIADDTMDLNENGGSRPYFYINLAADDAKTLYWDATVSFDGNYWMRTASSLLVADTVPASTLTDAIMPICGVSVDSDGHTTVADPQTRIGNYLWRRDGADGGPFLDEYIGEDNPRT